jgi:ABC-2 type transport system permease protein
MNQLAVFSGVLRYEFRMQIRRPALWITMLLFALLIVGIGGVGSGISGDVIRGELLRNAEPRPLLNFLAQWAYRINTFFPIAIGVLLADRLPRDRRTKSEELFTTTPGALSARLLGKYFGTLLATLIPVLIVYAAGIGLIAYAIQNMAALPMGLAPFVVIDLPGILFISAFSIACTSILWTPLYQFLFVGYWFWGNLLQGRFHIPTLSGTILTPIGGYMASGIFGLPFIQPGATAIQGVQSIILLLAIAALVMWALWGLLKWQQARQ